MSKLEDLLIREASELISVANGAMGCTVNYAEHCNEDALNGDAWLDNGTSYIWKVGLLGVTDGNKADWCSLYIGHQRDENAKPQLIGKLEYRDGENDDVGRSLHRYVDLINSTHAFHPVFHNDGYVPPADPQSVIKKLNLLGLLNGAAIRKALGKSDSLDAITPDHIQSLIEG